MACSEPNLEANKCSSKSLVGTGKILASAGALKLSSAIKLYLVVPQAGEVGRLGMVSSTPFGRIVAQGSITIRTEPDVGAEITFANLPQQVGGVAITLTGVDLTLNGTVDGKPFTRNPTSCAPATTSLVVTSYGDPTSSVAATSSFTPSACASLPFAPRLSGSATIGNYNGDTELSSTITQAGDEAATRQTQLTLPFGLLTRSDASSRACAASDPSTCPASATVGSATVTTPLSAAPLPGRVVLVANGSGTPGMAIVFAAPFGITLTGTTALTASGFTTTFEQMPDVPLSSVTVTLGGGSDSLLINGGSLCVGSPKLSASFTAQSASTATASAPLAVSGCPA